MNITARYNQTLIDMALQGAGDVEQCMNVAALNNLSLTATLTPGAIVTTPDATGDKQKLQKFFNTSPYNPASIGSGEAITGLTSFIQITPAIAKGALSIREGQTVIDMALQGSGDVDRLIEVAMLNGLSITDELVAGSLIITPGALLNKRSLALFFNAAPYYPASGEAGNNNNDADEHGVGYDVIEDDQIVYPTT